VYTATKMIIKRRRRRRGRRRGRRGGKKRGGWRPKVQKRLVPAKYLFILLYVERDTHVPSKYIFIYMYIYRERYERYTLVHYLFLILKKSSPTQNIYSYLNM